MKAIVKKNATVSLQYISKPSIKNPDDILIKVLVSGLCRTDIGVALGKIKSLDPIVIGHEFSGIIEELGSRVKDLSRGDRVAVMPVIPCGTCFECLSNKSSICSHSTMIGIHHQGAFAEYIVVPAKTVFKIPDTLTFKEAAYLEPVAASLAVLNTDLSKNEKGLVYGNNRIAYLTRAILEVNGFSNISVSEGPIEENKYDFIIETIATQETMEHILKGIRPRGKVILKSRQVNAVGMNIHTIVRKEIRLIGTHYGSFEEAINLMHSGKLCLDGLLGEVFPLENFSVADKGESTKQFYSAFEQHVWDR